MSRIERFLCAAGRSAGGLLYRDYAEFRIAIRLLAERADVRRRLGASGRAYVEEESNWPVVEARTHAFLESVSADRARQ